MADALRRRAALVVAGLGLAGCAGPSPPRLDEPPPGLEGIVPMRVLDGRGSWATATPLGDGAFATSRHVLEERGSIEVDGATTHYSIVGRGDASIGADWVIFRPLASLEHLRPLPLRPDHDPAPGDAIVAIGYPSLGRRDAPPTELARIAGRVTRPPPWLPGRSELVWARVSVWSALDGISGGPAVAWLDGRWSVIGIASRWAYGWIGFVPAREVRVGWFGGG